MSETPKKESKSSVKSWIIENILLVIIVIMVIFTAIKAPTFLSLNNFSNILSNIAVRFVIALGISGILITKGTDLSAGRIVGICGVLTALMLQRPDAGGVLYPSLAGSPVILVLLATMVLGAICGLVNGLLVSLLYVPPFIATLGTQVAIYGINMMLSQNQPIGQLNSGFTGFGTGGLHLGSLQIPWLALVAVVVGLLMNMLYKHTVYGKNMYAIGGNEIAAEVSGVNTRRSKIIIYALAGLLYGLGAFMLIGKTGSAAVGTGTGYDMEAIAAATIGGVSTSGGVGSVGGILVGVTVFELLKVCLQFLGITPEMTNVFQGIVIVAAVAMDIRKTMRKK